MEEKISEPDGVEEESKRDSLDVDIPDLEMTTDVSPGTQFRHIVEDIEAKAHSISQNILEEEKTCHESKSEIVTQTESKVSEKIFDESEKEEVSHEEKRRSVRELVQKHESIVKEKSIEKSISIEKDKTQPIVVEEKIEKIDKGTDEEAMPWTTEDIDDLIEEEQKLKRLTDSNIFESDDTERKDWETIEAIELESPSKLPSPLEQQYPVYIVDDAKMPEGQTIHSTVVEDMKTPELSEELSADGVAKTDVKGSDEQVHFAKEISWEQDLTGETVDAVETNLNEVNVEVIAESKVEICQEEEYVDIVTEPVSELTKTLEKLSPEAGRDFSVSEVEYQPQQLVECEELESLDKLDIEPKAVEVIIPSEQDVSDKVEEVISETLEEREYISAKPVVMEEELVCASVTTTDLVSPQAEVSESKEQLHMHTDFQDKSSEMEVNIDDIDKYEKQIEKSVEKEDLQAKFDQLLEFETSPAVVEEILVESKIELKKERKDVGETLESEYELKTKIQDTDTEISISVKPDKGLSEEIRTDILQKEEEKLPEKSGDEKFSELEMKPALPEEIKINSRDIIIKESIKQDIVTEQTDHFKVDSPVSDEDLVEMPTHVSRESSFDFPDKKTDIKEEKSVEAEISEKTVETEVLDKIIGEEVSEKTLETEVSEKTVEAEISEKIIEAEVSQKIVETEVTEKIVEAEVSEENVEAEVSEKTVEAEVSDKTIEAEVSEKIVEAEVTEKTVEAEVSEKNIEVEDSEKTVEAAVSEITVEAEMLEKDLEAEVSEKTVEAEVSDKTIEVEVSEKILEAEICDKTIERQISEYTEETVETEYTEKTVEAEVSDINVETEVSEKILEVGVSEKTVGEVTEKTVEAEVVDKTIEAPVSKISIEAEYTEKTVETEDKERTVEAEVTEINVETEVPEKIVEVGVSEESADAEVTEKTLEAEVSEHDAYFVQDKQMNRLKKQTVLLSRQESNIEITLDEFEVQNYENEDEMKESKDNEVVKATTTEQETKETQQADIADTVVDVRSEFEENKPLQENVSHDIETEETIITETQTGLIQSDSIDEEPNIEEKPFRGRIYTDIMQAADEEMEGEPVGFSVEPSSDDENEYVTDEKSVVKFGLDEGDEAVEDGDGSFYPEVAESTEISMKLSKSKEDYDKMEYTAEVIEIIEGDEDEDTIPPSASLLSELVDVEGNGSIKPSTPENDISLSYTDRVEQKIDIKSKDAVSHSKSDEQSKSESEKYEIELSVDEKSDALVGVRKETIESSESETYKSCETETDIDKLDVQELEAEKEKDIKVEEFIDIVEVEKDEVVEIDYTYNVDEFDESYIDRTERFIEQYRDGFDISEEKIGKAAVKSDFEVKKSFTKQMDSSSFTTQQQLESLDESNQGQMQEDLEAIESDSIEDDEVDSYIERRSQRSVEPEQQSTKSSERPLSPTDYTLEMEIDESAVVGYSHDADVDDEDEEEAVEAEGRISADVSQQIFIEQTIEKEKSRPIQTVRELGDGEEKVEEVPPSPSEYTLVTSYEQEKLKQVLSTPEKKSPLARVFREEAMSVSMDESVLKKELGIERNIMSASYDEEALKYVYDEEDIMVSSAEHIMVDSLIASSLEPEDVRVSGSVCSGRDEDYSVSSSDHKSDVMTDSYDQDSLQKSVGSARESSLADSMDPDMLQKALGRDADLMATSMDQDALQRSLGLESDMSLSMDQERLKRCLELGHDENVMTDSLEKDQMNRSLDVVREELILTNSLDDEIMEKALGFGRESVMETSMDQNALKVSLGDKTADLMTTSLEFDDLDALHRSLGLAGSESLDQKSKMSEVTEITEESQATEGSDGMLESLDEEALKKALDSTSKSPDLMAASMDQDALRRSLGLEHEDLMSGSMDPDALRASLGIDKIQSSDEDSEEIKLIKSKEIDPMMASMDQEALTASLGLDKIEEEKTESKTLMSELKEEEISQEHEITDITAEMMESMDETALKATLELDKQIDIEKKHDDVATQLHATGTYFTSFSFNVLTLRRTCIHSLQFTRSLLKVLHIMFIDQIKLIMKID